MTEHLIELQLPFDGGAGLRLLGEESNGTVAHQKVRTAEVAAGEAGFRRIDLVAMPAVGDLIGFIFVATNSHPNRRSAGG